MSASFKVLQFNMQFGQRWDDAYPDHAAIDLDLTIAEIQSHDADIVLLQEVEQALPGGAQGWPPPNYTRLRRALAGYDGYFSYPRPDPRELPFGIGLAIFSRSRLRDTVQRNLPSPPVSFEFRGKMTTPTDRLLIGASTRIGRRPVRVYNTHLLAFFMLEASSEDNPEQRRIIVDELKASDGATLLGGDFNVRRHQGLVRQFSSAGFRTVQSRRATWRRRPYVLDHIFYSRHLHPLRHVLRPTPASDHHVLAAEFEFVE